MVDGRTLGETLRAAREEQQLTIQEIADRTKVRAEYLEALEEERYQMLPAKTYVTSFIRSYARFLGLDEQEALRLYYQEKTNGVEVEDLWADEAEPERQTSRVAWIAIGIGVLTVIVALLFFLLRKAP